MVKPQNFGYSNDEDLKSALEHLHYEKKMGQKDIADHYIVSRHTIIRAFKDLDIKVVNHNEIHNKCGFESDRDMASAIFSLYHEEEMTLEQIAEKFDISIKSLSECMERNLIFRRGTNILGSIFRNLEINETEHSIITAMLLSNGYIKKDTLHYSCKPEEADVLVEELARFGTEYDGYKISTKSFPVLGDYYNDWYKDGEKEIPEFELTPAIMNWWYCFDGSTMNGSMKLYSDYDKINTKRLIWNMPVEAKHYSRRGSFTEIIFVSKTEDRIKLLEWMGRCKHEVFSYKWLVYDSNRNIVADLR
jgi:predicted DNA-binding protein YlxM (UPF0122 family)